MRFSKIQKYSPTESAKVYDKAVNRKSKVHFNPHQTLDYLKSDVANMEISYETKKNIVKQYLDVSIQYYVLSLFISVSGIYSREKVCLFKRLYKNIAQKVTFDT